MFSHLLFVFFFVFSCKSEFLDYEETHLHSSTFGGMTRSTPEHNHLELYVGKNGVVEVYVYNSGVNPVKLQNPTGYIELLTEPQKRYPISYNFSDHHDSMFGQIPKGFANPLLAIVHVENKGVIYRAKFNYNVNDYPDRVAHMHDPRQGGQVAMLGETHVEMVVVKPGEYQVYFSDIHRAPLPPTLSKNSSLEIEPDSDNPEKLQLQIDPTQKFLQASGVPSSAKPLNIRVWLTLSSKPEPVDFSFP